MKRAGELVNESMERISGLMPWDIEEMYSKNELYMVVDVREPWEFDIMHIPGSVCVPRGIIEGAAEWGSRNTVPKLAAGRKKKIILVCVGGERSAMSADMMQEMGYVDVHNMKLGLRGWNDNEFPLEDMFGRIIDPDEGDLYFNRPARPDQMEPYEAE